MLFTLLAFVFALGILITFHEFGHYWVARRCGVRVLRFSVGFGKVLLCHTDRHGTEWAISAIPLGGYVKMQDEPPPGATRKQERESFNRQPVGKRMAVMAAGPFANLLLAAALYALLGLIGTIQPQAIVAAPAAHSAAAQAGFKQGDRIVSIDHSVVRSWNDVRWLLLDALTSGGDVSVVVDSGHGVTHEHTLHLEVGKVDSGKTDLLAKAGLSLSPGKPKVDKVDAGGAGAAAGLKAGDIITAMDAVEHPSMDAVVAYIQKHAGASVSLGILRDGKPMTLTVTPRPQAAKGHARTGHIGVLLGADLPLVKVRYGVLDSLAQGVKRTAETTWLSLKMMGRMVTGSVSLRSISGPVTIADYAGQTARIGLAAYIGFLALISVSIGVLNLLPIPMLDGGQLLYCILEAVRGRPVSEQWRAKGQQVGLGLLMALMVLAFFNDFTRLFS